MSQSNINNRIFFNAVLAELLGFHVPEEVRIDVDADIGLGPNPFHKPIQPDTFPFPFHRPEDQRFIVFFQWCGVSASKIFMQ